MEKVLALAQEEIERLRQENQNFREEKETLRYELKQILGKIFKPEIKPDPNVNRPKRGALCGHRRNSRRPQSAHHTIFLVILIWVKLEQIQITKRVVFFIWLVSFFGVDIQILLKK